MMNEVYVIVRSVGEYNYRMDTPILFVETEEDAQEAIRLADSQKQSGVKKPAYRYENTHAWFDEFGNEVEWSFRVTGDNLKFRAKPNAEQIEHQNRLWSEEYDKACRDLGHIDPSGCWPECSYEYHKVTRLNLKTGGKSA